MRMTLMKCSYCGAQAKLNCCTDTHPTPCMTCDSTSLRQASGQETSNQVFTYPYAPKYYMHFVPQRSEETDNVSNDMSSLIKLSQLGWIGHLKYMFQPNMNHFNSNTLPCNLSSRHSSCAAECPAHQIPTFTSFLFTKWQ